MKEIKLFTPYVSVKWVTPAGDQMIADMARVSVKDNEGKPVTKLIKYMADHGHNSPFDMVNLCVEVHAPRDISRQILRHWSIHPQEFSQRYAEVTDDMFCIREARRQHPTNKQMSVSLGNTEEDSTLEQWWDEMQRDHVADTAALYHLALGRGIAKEQARVILPEGNTMSRLYLNGTVRSWIYYLKSRTDIDATQREHVAVARCVEDLFAANFPLVYAAFFGTPEYQLVNSSTYLPVNCKARTADDVRRWAELRYHDEEITVSFQPGFHHCRVTVRKPGVRVEWFDYLLEETGD